MSRTVASLTLANGTGTREFRLDIVGSVDGIADMVAGDFAVLHWRHWTTGLTPPQAPTSVTIPVLTHGGTTIRTLNPGTAVTGSGFGDRVPQPDVYFTSNGLSGGSARAGLLEFNIRATSTGGLAPYDVSTDNRGTQSGGGTVTRERGWERATTTMTYTWRIGSTPTALYCYNDVPNVLLETAVPLFGAFTVGFNIKRQDTSAFLASQSSSWTNGSSSLSLNFTTVSNAYPVGPYALTGEFSVASATPSEPFVPSSLTESADASLDNRVTMTSHMQKNDNAFGVAKNAGAQRLTSELCFLASRLTNARGEGLDGISVTRHLYDAGQLTGTPTAGVASNTSSTGIADGQSGWLSTFLVWDEALPGGSWKVRHSTSSGANGLLTPVDSSFTLVSSDPNLTLVTAGGPGTPNQDTRHFTPGEVFVAGAACFNTGSNELVPMDDNQAWILIARFNLSNGTAEILQADGVTWVAGQTPGASYYHTATETYPGSHVYTVAFLPVQTATWSASDLFTVGKGFVGGVPVSNYLKEVTTSGANNHTGYSFDGPGFVGFPTR